MEAIRPSSGLACVHGAARPRERARSVGAMSRVPSPLRPLRVLLADDDRALARTLSECFRLRGIRIVEVYDGRAALDLARRRNFDVLILDLRMHG